MKRLDGMNSTMSHLFQLGLVNALSFAYGREWETYFEVNRPLKFWALNVLTSSSRGERERFYFGKSIIMDFIMRENLISHLCQRDLAVGYY